MARRWLRSPRIRNTFMVLAAAPAPCRAELLWELSGARGAATSPSPSLAVPQAGAAPPRSRAPAARTLGRAVTWRDGPAQDRSQEVAFPTSPRRRAGQLAQRLLARAPPSLRRHPGFPSSPEITVRAWHSLKVLTFIALLRSGKWKWG